MAKIIQYRGLGRRKSSTARVILIKGSGQITINKRPAKDYLMSDIFLQEINEPLELLKVKSNYDLKINVKGGGLSGQAGAIRLGVARALLVVSKENRKALKEAHLLTRDARVKERKKPGLRKARRARQFSKR